MKGNNTLTLCQAEMVAALQHYFNCDLFRTTKSPVVTAVGYDSQAGVFNVKVTEREPLTGKVVSGG